MTRRRHRRQRAAVVISAVLLLSGCGALGEAGSSVGETLGEKVDSVRGAGSTAEGAGSGAAGGAAEQREWMARLCGGLGEVVDTAATQRTADRSDVRQLPQVLADRVRTVGESVDAQVANLDALGPPPVEGADAVQDELRELLESRSASLEKSATFVEEADPGNAIGYVQTARAAQSAYTAGPVLIHDVSRVPALEDAFAATPECTRLDKGGDNSSGSDRGGDRGSDRGGDNSGDTDATPGPR